MSKQTPRRGSKVLDEKTAQEEITKKQKKIRQLMEELQAFEAKNNSLKVQVQNNESVLNMLDNKNAENKEFSKTLQEAIESKKATTFTIANPFIKRNFRKLKELVSEKTIKDTSTDRGSKSRQKSKGKKRGKSRDSVDRSTDQSEVEQLRLENEFMLKVISKDNSCPLPTHFKCWNRSG